MTVIAVLALRAKCKGVTECSKFPLSASDSCFKANFAGFPTLFFQIVFSLAARSNNSMSVGAFAVVDIGLSKYSKVLSGHSAGQHPFLCTRPKSLQYWNKMIPVKTHIETLYNLYFMH